MQVWLFDIMQWPYKQAEIGYPFPSRLYDHKLASELYDGNLALLKRADELGYDGVCLAEHHFAFNGTAPSPNLIAAALATQTSNVKIALLGNCLPIHGHPVRLAEELAMIDVLSHGRLVSGFLRGTAKETHAYNIDNAEARSRWEEAWELIVKAWTEPEPFEWQGEYYHYDAISIIPRPVQQPHPPILAAANSAESIEWAASHHAGLLTSFSPTEQIAETLGYFRKYAQEKCGWTPAPEDTGVSRQVYVSTTDAKAREEVEAHAMQFYTGIGESVRDPGAIAGSRVRLSERSYAYKSGPHRAMPIGDDARYDKLIEDGYLVAGSPDTVTRLIRKQEKELGVGRFLTYIPFGTMEPAQAMRSVELFGKEVLPNLR
jgi:alkanesulfonate monooxygenase SsuD/methylene tetrahydromethanopterin reductase-like flavin-dependent oxidoreductase (luciferase family)